MAAIYQQARPYTFAQVLGQEHVKDVLVAALTRDKLGHAYLFSGPRGVGKTTTARLLAMAVNCELDDPAQRPCGQCASCQLVRHNNHPDVIELDAASNNSVDDVRDLRDKVQLSAIRGGKRVWVLDEAHMLSRAASNALLKTLEEPPANLLFILATTEPEKLPPTILSRCQHFRFRRLSEAEISSKLQRLCAQAEVLAEDEALALVARAADGAMRDAESLLERLLASGKPIVRSDAEAALGLPPQDRLRALAQHLASNSVDALLSEAAALYRDGFAPRSLAEQLNRTLRDALHAQLGLADDSWQLELSQEALLRLIHALDDEDSRFLRHDDLFSLEVALIKALNSRRPPTAPVAAPVTAPLADRAASLHDFDPHSSRPLAAKPASNQTSQLASTNSSSNTNTTNNNAAPTSQAALSSSDWNKVKRQADIRMKAFLEPAIVHIEGKKLHITFNEKHKFHYTQLDKRFDDLQTLIAQQLGEDVEVRLTAPGGGSSRKKP